MKEEKYEKILCFLELVMSIIFLIITWLIRPMTILLGILGLIMLVKGVYDLILMIKTKRNIKNNIN